MAFRSEVFLQILRDSESWKFKVDAEKPSSFQNNVKNNRRDIFLVSFGTRETVAFLCQTVANHPAEKIGDTIAPGPFKVRAFVDPRKFNGQIHGILDTLDTEGQKVDADSMQWDTGKRTGRWLIHDSYLPDKGRDATYLWSGGCFMLRPGDLLELNRILTSVGIRPGDTFKGHLMEYTPEEMDEIRARHALA